MGRTAQQRFAATQALGEDAPTGMERGRRAALRRAEHATDRAYREGRQAGRHAARERGTRSLVRPRLPDAFPADEADENHDERNAYRQGAEEAIADERRRAARATASRVTSSKPARRAVSTAQAGSGLVLGMLAWALALSFLRDGPDGPKAWLRSKFLNDPTPGKKLQPAGAGTPASPTGSSLTPTSPTSAPTSPFLLAPIPAVPASPLAAGGPG